MPPLWHCPHCGTPQPEAARCWVCRKSSTSCATCRSFRRGVAGSLGYCVLDRRREPLRGDEIRACWDAAATAPTGRSFAWVGAGVTLPMGRVPLAWRDLDPPTQGQPRPDGEGCPTGRPEDGALPVEGLPIERSRSTPETQRARVDGFWADLEA